MSMLLLLSQKSAFLTAYTGRHKQIQRHPTGCVIERGYDERRPCEVRVFGHKKPFLATRGVPDHAQCLFNLNRNILVVAQLFRAFIEMSRNIKAMISATVFHAIERRRITCSLVASSLIFPDAVSSLVAASTYLLRAIAIMLHKRNGSRAQPLYL